MFNAREKNGCQEAEAIRGEWRIRAERAVLLLTLAVAAFFVFRIGAAAMYARRGTVEGFRRAIQWNPADPSYDSELSHALRSWLSVTDVHQLVALDQTAVRLGPNRVAQWVDLASDSEWAGDNLSAARAYARALKLAPNSPSVNWAVGNFYLRSGSATAALQRFRVTIAGDPELRQAAFELAWRATDDGAAILREAVPMRGDALLDYLNYLSGTGRLDDAALAWREILQSGIRFAPAEAFRYLDALLVSKRPDELRAAWNAMLAAHLDGMPTAARQGNLINNGDFKTDVLGGGLDWRVEPVEGARVALRTDGCLDGAQCLEITFDGKHNLDYRNIYQFVPVQPDTTYRFSAYVKAQGLTTDSGVRFFVLDYYERSAPVVFTNSVTGTTGWTLEEVEVRAGPSARILEIVLSRASSTKFDNKVSGRCWIDHVGLVGEK